MMWNMHYNDVLMRVMTVKITGVPIICSTVCSDADQRKHQCSARVSGLCEGNPPVIGVFPSQKSSEAKNVSIWWRHHVIITKSHSCHDVMLQYCTTQVSLHSWCPYIRCPTPTRFTISEGHIDCPFYTQYVAFSLWTIASRGPHFGELNIEMVQKGGFRQIASCGFRLDPW